MVVRYEDQRNQFIRELLNSIHLELSNRRIEVEDVTFDQEDNLIMQKNGFEVRTSYVGDNGWDYIDASIENILSGGYFDYEGYAKHTVDSFLKDIEEMEANE